MLRMQWRVLLRLLRQLRVWLWGRRPSLGPPPRRLLRLLRQHQFVRLLWQHQFVRLLR
jgi:hypothetical protein